MKKSDSPVHDASLFRGRWRWPITALLLGALVLGWVLYNRPAHIYPVARDLARWKADVHLVRESGLAASQRCFVPDGQIKKVPGVGTVTAVCTWGTYHNEPLKIRFVGRNGRGLLYMTQQLHDWTLQVGYCTYPLGGPWYELTKMVGLGCPRGFGSVPTP